MIQLLTALQTFVIVMVEGEIGYTKIAAIREDLVPTLEVGLGVSQDDARGMRLIQAGIEWIFDHPALNYTCPNCHEADKAKLVWLNDSVIKCQSCEFIY